MEASVLLKEKKNQSMANASALEGYEKYYDESIGTHSVKLENFTKYVTRESITRFLARHEAFMKQLNVCGSIVELGVFRGGSIMQWSHLSSIYEPVNYTRHIFGFDTFEGFPEINEKDISETGKTDLLRKGGLNVEYGMKEDIEKSIALWDKTRYLNHIPKTTLIKGDIVNTLPEFIEQNQHLVVSLLHIDVDLYEPTKLALELLTPRMPKGAVILFDELNMKIFPGETMGVFETVGIMNLRIHKPIYAPNISYAIIE